MLQWMVWTMPVAIFYTIIGLSLIGMTLWEIRVPTIPRKGFLPMVTTRGDRFFIGLLGSAFINLIWLGVTDFSQWFAVFLSAVYMILIAKKG